METLFEYKTIKRKSLLYKSGVEYADYCLNHVEGCSHGCKYPCYAFLMKRRCGIVKTYEEWCQPKIVSNALDLLEKEIPRYKNKINYVHLCFSTDPFMYEQKEIHKLSLKIINELNSNEIKVTVLTKGILPEDLSNLNGFSTNNEYGISLVSLNDDFKRSFEPNSAAFKDRIESLKYLHEKGYKTYVSIEPYPPPNFIEQDLNAILDNICFVDKIIFGKLNYNARSSEYRHLKEFYQSRTEIIINYCERHSKEYHIKNGTPVNG